MYRNSIQNNKNDNNSWIPGNNNNRNRNNRNNSKRNNLKNSNNNNMNNENEDITLFKHHIIDVLYECYRLDSLLPQWVKQKLIIRELPTA